MQFFRDYCVMPQRCDEWSSQAPEDWAMKPHFWIDYKYLSSAGFLWRIEQKSFTHVCSCMPVCTHTWACRNPVCSVVLFTNHQDFHISSGTYFWGSLSWRLNFWNSLRIYFYHSPPPPHWGSWSWEKLSNAWPVEIVQKNWATVSETVPKSII